MRREPRHTIVVDRFDPKVWRGGTFIKLDYFFYGLCAGIVLGSASSMLGLWLSGFVGGAQ